jgi:hypothetical protein
MCDGDASIERKWSDERTAATVQIMVSLTLERGRPSGWSETMAVLGKKESKEEVLMAESVKHPRTANGSPIVPSQLAHVRIPLLNAFN